MHAKRGSTRTGRVPPVVLASRYDLHSTAATIKSTRKVRCANHVPHEQMAGYKSRCKHAPFHPTTSLWIQAVSMTWWKKIIPLLTMGSLLQVAILAVPANRKTSHLMAHRLSTNTTSRAFHMHVQSSLHYTRMKRWTGCTIASRLHGRTARWAPNAESTLVISAEGSSPKSQQVRPVGMTSPTVSTTAWMSADTISTLPLFRVFPKCPQNSHLQIIGETETHHTDWIIKSMWKRTTWRSVRRASHGD